MEDIYRSIYNFVSNDAHSNIRALISRHFEMNGDYFSVVYYRGDTEENFISEIDTVTSLLIQSGIKIHNVLNSPIIKDVEALNDKLQEWRNEHLTKALTQAGVEDAPAG